MPENPSPLGDAPPIGRVDAFIELGRRGGATLVVAAFALGASLWPLFHLGQRARLWRNGLTWDDRVEAALWSVAGTLGVGALFAGWVWLRARREGLTAAIGAVRDRSLWAFGAPALVVLSVKTIERKFPFLTISMAVIAAAAVAISVYRSWPAPPPRLGRRRLWLALVAVVALAVVVQMARLAIANHLAFNTQTADLGYYDNLFYQSWHGRPLGVSLMKSGVHYSGHFDPFLVLLTPIYALAPNAMTLMVLQIVWLASGAWPIYRLALRATERASWAAGLAVVYLLYPAMHGVAMYEFHSLAMLVPLLLWLFDRVQVRGWRTFWVLVPLLWLVREDVSLLLCFVGAGMVVAGRETRRHGLALIIGSIAYFVVVKKFIMVSSDMLNCTQGGACFNYYFKDLIPHDLGVKDIVLSLWSNPGFALRHLFSEPKVLFLLQIFVPLAALPLFARRGRVALLYGLAFTLLASHKAVHTIHFQYSAVLFPVAFALAAAGLGRVARGGLGWLRLDPQRLGGALLVGMLVFTTFASWKFGALVENDAFRVGYRRPVREVTDEHRAARAWLLAEVAKLPADARIGVTRNLGPHLSNREVTLRFPGQNGAEYLVVRESDLRKGERPRWVRFRSKAKLRRISQRRGVGIYEIPDAERWEWPKEAWR